MPKSISCFRLQQMTTDYPESYEITFKGATTAASPPCFPTSFHFPKPGRTSPTRGHRAQSCEAASPVLPSTPSFSPGVCGLPWDFSLDSPPRLCQVCCDVEVTGYCQQEAGNEIRIAAGGPPSTPPSLPAAPLSSPAETGSCQGELQNFHVRRRIK